MPKTQDGYTAIEVKNKSPEPESIIEVELEDITDEPNIVAEEKEEAPKEEVKVENTKDKKEDKTPEKKEEAPKKKKSNRAQKRIKQVLSEKAELEAKLEEERKARFELEKQYKTGNKTTKEVMKSSLDSTLQTLTRSLQEAMENGDSAKAVELQDEMMNAKMQLAGLTAEIENLNNEPETEFVPTQQKAPAPEVSEKALDWIEEYPQFQTDKLFHVAALTVNSTLVEEGFDAESDEFYEELTARLSPRFPEVFGVADKNSVKYNQQPSNEELGDENNNSSDSENESTSSSRETAQTVSAGSRTPPHSGGKKHSGTSEKVKLSPADVAQAERWGLPLEQMARRVAHNEKNRKQDGYVPIEIKKK